MSFGSSRRSFVVSIRKVATRAASNDAWGEGKLGWPEDAEKQTDYDEDCIHVLLPFLFAIRLDDLHVIIVMLPCSFVWIVGKWYCQGRSTQINWTRVSALTIVFRYLRRISSSWDRGENWIIMHEKGEPTAPEHDHSC
jgi:hypothetical protein